jgi:DNA-binding response OmpR family regulator
MEAQQNLAEMTIGFGQSPADMRTLGLIAELVAALRGSGSAPSSAAIARTHRMGEIEIDEHYRTVSIGGREVALRPKEYDLLIALARKNGAPASKRELFREVWNYDVATDSRTLDQHIFELRRKLEPEPRRPRYIVTVRKFGYCLKAA